MARYVKAVECAEKISEKLNIPLGDLVDVFAEIPTADVVSKKEVERLEAQIKHLTAEKERLKNMIQDLMKG